MKHPFLLEEKKWYIGYPAKQQNPGVEDETLRPLNKPEMEHKY
jgi:hypothetical protein